MANNQYAYAVINDTEQKVIWKAFEIHASQVALQYVVSFWRVGGFLEAGSQLLVELIRKLQPCGVFVVIHDP
jgi:hypothetical protein